MFTIIHVVLRQTEMITTATVQRDNNNTWPEDLINHGISQSMAARLSNSSTGVLHLPTPVIVVGYPKSGTTSLHQFFTCNHIHTQHFCCCGDINDNPPCQIETMAVCILHNLASPDRKMLEGCGDYDVFCQIDGERPIQRNRQNQWGILMEDGSLEIHNGKSQQERQTMFRHFLPQHFYLDRLHADYPQATFLLPLRNSQEWANSVFNWFQMRGRVVNEYIHFNRTIERPGRIRAKEFLSRIYDEHTALVRSFVARHPSHAFVEVNITDPNAGKYLASSFGLNAACWGHHNQVGDRANSIKRKSTEGGFLS